MTIFLWLPYNKVFPKEQRLKVCVRTDELILPCETHNILDPQQKFSEGDLFEFLINF